MSSGLYEQFFLHFFVNPELHKFTYLQEKFKSYLSPGLDHPKKSFELGYLKNYKRTCSKYLCYVPNQKMQTKFTVNAVMEIIDSIYAQYAIFFHKGGAYRMIFNSYQTESINMKKLKSYIQQLTLIKLCEKFQELKSHFKSLDRLVMGFFFTLNYIKTCNVDVKGFCALLSAQEDDEALNIQNVFGNFLIEKLGYLPDSDSVLSQYQRRGRIKVKRFERILKVLSRDEELTNLSLLAQQNNQSFNMNINSLTSEEFSTIKSSQLKQQEQIIEEQQNLRTVIALEILMNFIKNNHIKLTQIKIYKLLRLVGVVKSKEEQQEQKNQKNVFANLNTWEEVLNFCFEHNSLKHSNSFFGQNKFILDERLSYEKILLMEICKVNFIVSQRLFGQIHDLKTLQSYREQSYEFILNYLNELFEGKNQIINKETYLIFKKLKLIYNFGEVCLKPLIKKILKHPQLHQIYIKYSHHNKP